jgi:hypothetical protein
MRLSSGEVLLGGVVGLGWWLVVDGEDGGRRVVDGPFPDRTEASWALATEDFAEGTRPSYGIRHADGTFTRRPSPQDHAWLAEIEEQLERLPAGWDAGLDEDDPLITLVVELTAVLSETGLPLHDPAAARGGVALSPEPALGGVLVTWRQHDRMSVDHVYGVEADLVVQEAMTRALADVLELRGFAVDPFGDGAGHLVRPAWAARQ